MIDGHCSQCHKAWTLDTEQGLCQWCGKLAVCQSQRTQALRSIKSRSKDKERQDHHNGNGYDHLEGNWLTYYKVASHFSHKAKAQDRDDLLHDIMLTLHDVAQSKPTPMSEAVMYRIASHKVADYWRKQYKLTNGLSCGACSKAQNQKCKEDWLYADCPKAMRIDSLTRPITDSEGNMTELGELIADDKALDLDAWLDLRTFLSGYPLRLIAIAQKTAEGEALSNKERQYLWYWRRKEQEALVLS